MSDAFGLGHRASIRLRASKAFVDEGWNRD